MIVWSRRALGVAVLGCSMLLQTAGATAAGLADLEAPWIMPFDVNQPTPDRPGVPVTSEREFYDFMWQSFVALNWPQDPEGNRAEPDTMEGLAPWDDGDQSQGPVVWESYLRPNQVFVDPRIWNGSWNDPPAPDPSHDLALCPAPPPGVAPKLISSYATSYSDLSNGLNQPYIQANYPTAPVVDQNGNYLRYEVGINQAYFTYIGEFGYFRPRTQIRSVERYIDFVANNGTKPPQGNRSYFQRLPTGTESYLAHLPDYALQGMVEWKAAWKVLDGDDVPERFYRRWAYFLNPDQTCTGPFLVGLVALHVHRFTEHGHIGTTFEQVDNTQLQPAYSQLEVEGAAPLPAHASLNPGTEVSPDYPNGYEICDSEGADCVAGKEGILPTPIKDGELLLDNPGITNVVRQVPIPDDVQQVNAEWRERLRGTVWFYYQMIGTQNKNVNEEPGPNRNLGPGVIGAQASNTDNLINAALESYTQKGWSCALCHQNAFPLGVSYPLPPIQQEYEDLRTISFVLQNAQSSEKSGKRRHRKRRY